MPKKTYTSLQSNYTVCEHSDCPMAATCLHQLAYKELLKTETYLRLLNPTQCVKDGTCKFFRDNTPVTYARGFTNFQKKMTRTRLVRHLRQNLKFIKTFN